MGDDGSADAMTVNLDQQEWNQLLAVLAQAPWHVANPIIMKIGEQLRQQGMQGSAGRPNGPQEASEAPQAQEGRQRPS